MIPAGFVQALVTYADVVEGGADAIQEEFERLFASVAAGDGTTLVNSNVNGKEFGFQVSMTVEEKFSAYAEALKEINGTATKCTYAAFTGLQR